MESKNEKFSFSKSFGSIFKKKKPTSDKFDFERDDESNVSSKSNLPNDAQMSIEFKNRGNDCLKNE
jgi:hypothetical protein